MFAKRYHFGRLLSAAALVALGGAVGCDGDSPDPTSPPVPVATPDVTSNFDNKTDDGWTGQAGAALSAPVTPHDGVFQSGGGSVYISGTDHWFRAPEKFLNNKAGYYGGTLNYWYFWSNPAENPGAVSGSPDVVIAGRNGVSITHDHPGDPTTEFQTWQFFSHPINDASGWKVQSTGESATRADIEGVLEDVAHLLIRGSKRHATRTNHYIDEVELTG